MEPRNPIKTIEEIEEEFWENEWLSPESLKDLEWHVEHNPNPHTAIIIATDAGLTSLTPLIARHLDHPDDFIRARAINCLLVRLHQTHYGTKGLQMAQGDPIDDVRGLAVRSLGSVIDDVRKKLRHDMADYI